MEPFTEDSPLFLVYMDSKAAGPTQVVSGRAALKPVFDHLNIYQTTTHFNGQTTVILDQLTEAIVEMARAGMGVELLARWMILRRVGTGSLKVVRLGPSGLQRDWRIAFRRADPRFEELRNISSPLSKRLRRLLQHLLR